MNPRFKLTIYFSGVSKQKVFKVCFHWKVCPLPVASKKVPCSLWGSSGLVAGVWYVLYWDGEVCTSCLLESSDFEAVCQTSSKIQLLPNREHKTHIASAGRGHAILLRPRVHRRFGPSASDASVFRHPGCIDAVSSPAANSLSNSMTSWNIWALYWANRFRDVFSAKCPGAHRPDCQCACSFRPLSHYGDFKV